MKTFILVIGITIASILFYLMIAREMKFKLIKEGSGLKGIIASFHILDLHWGTLSEQAKHRLEFCFILFLVLVGIATAIPWVYSWLWEHSGLMLFMALIILGYIIKPPKSPWVLKLEVFMLLLMGIYSGIPAENKGWFQKTTASVSHRETTVVSKQRATENPKERTIEVVAEPGAFTEVKIPPTTSFRWDIQDGCLVAVMHAGNPHGTIYDCADHIELGNNIQNLRLGFSSKTQTPVRVAVRLTPV